MKIREKCRQLISKLFQKKQKPEYSICESKVIEIFSKTKNGEFIKNICNSLKENNLVNDCTIKKVLDASKEFLNKISQITKIKCKNLDNSN